MVYGKVTEITVRYDTDRICTRMEALCTVKLLLLSDYHLSLQSSKTLSLSHNMYRTHMYV